MYIYRLGAKFLTSLRERGRVIFFPQNSRGDYSEHFRKKNFKIEVGPKKVIIDRKFHLVMARHAGFFTVPSFEVN
jgi:hypothetical protein